MRWFVALGFLLAIALFFFLGYSRYAPSKPTGHEWQVKAVAIPEKGLWRFEYPGPDGGSGSWRTLSG